MPELPEVESIRLQLEKFLIGHKIKAVTVNYRKTLQGDENKLVNGKILSVRRFGKVNVIDLDNGYSLAAHVKMTGQFLYFGPNLKNPKESKKITGGVPGKHTHVVFKLDRNGILYFNDVRKFGWIKVLRTGDVEADIFINKLGPEPLKSLTLEIFKNILLNSKRNIKTVLMDQGKLSGVGNIYANDALWLAKINPKRLAKSLTSGEAGDLFKAIESVLKEGLKYGGASESAFVTPDGGEGDYQNHSYVYGKKDTICSRCKKAKIEKVFIGGRGTFYCPICQK